jgi:hypothetical protein
MGHITGEVEADRLDGPQLAGHILQACQLVKAHGQALEQTHKRGSLFSVFLPF